MIFKKLRRLAGLSLLVGCMTTGGSVDDYVEEWDGQTFHYNVSVRQEQNRFGECAEREITLKRRIGTHPSYIVSYVKATDRGCNDKIDSWYFRDRLDPQRVSKWRLSQDVMNAYYNTRPTRLWK